MIDGGTALIIMNSQLFSSQPDSKLSALKKNRLAFSSAHRGHVALYRKEAEIYLCSYIRSVRKCEYFFFRIRNQNLGARLKNFFDTILKKSFIKFSREERKWLLSYMNDANLYDEKYICSHIKSDVKKIGLFFTYYGYF